MIYYFTDKNDEEVRFEDHSEARREAIIDGTVARINDTEGGVYFLDDGNIDILPEGHNIVTPVTHPITPADILTDDLLNRIRTLIDEQTDPIIALIDAPLMQQAAGETRDQAVQMIERMFSHEEQTLAERVIEASQMIEGIRIDMKCLIDDAPECEPEFDSVDDLLQEASEQLLELASDDYDKASTETKDESVDLFHAAEAMTLIGRSGVKHTAQLMVEQLHTVQIHAIMNFLFIHWNISSEVIVDKAFADCPNPHFVKHMKSKLIDECNGDIIRFMGLIDPVNRAKIITLAMMNYGAVTVAEVKNEYQQIIKK